MGWTSTDLDVINAAIASGAKRVKFKDREIEYNSMTDLLRARDLIRRELGITSGRNTRILSEFSKTGDETCELD